MLRWFRKKEPENYEEVLASLATEISARQARLADIRQRERRASLWFTLYATAAWGIYIALWYARLVPQAASKHPLERVLAGAPVLTGPLVYVVVVFNGLVLKSGLDRILFARRIMQAWYTRIGNAEEKTLKALSVKQRTKIEEIKKATNYYSTKNLLERYDETPARQRKPDSPATANFPGGIPGTPQRPGGPQQQPPQVQTTPARPGQPQPPNGANNLLSPVQQPIAPPRRQWYDRLADALLGDDADIGAPSTKYALICARCFAHNGLVHQEQWATTRYACPKCGFFNEAPGAKSASSRTPSPNGASPPPAAPASLPPTQPRIQPLAFQTPGRASLGRSPLSKSTSGSDEDDDGDGEEVGNESRMDVDSSM